MSRLPELSCDELAVIYSAAILADDDVSITVDKISTILKAANVDVEPIWPALYARALTGVNVRQMLTTVVAGLPAAGSQPHLGGSGAPGGVPSAPDTARPADAGTLKHAQEATNGDGGGGGGGDDDDDDEDLGMSLFDFD